MRQQNYVYDSHNIYTVLISCTSNFCFSKKINKLQNFGSYHQNTPTVCMPTQSQKQKRKKKRLLENLL